MKIDYVYLNLKHKSVKRRKLLLFKVINKKCDLLHVYWLCINFINSLKRSNNFFTCTTIDSKINGIRDGHDFDLKSKSWFDFNFKSSHIEWFWFWFYGGQPLFFTNSGHNIIIIFFFIGEKVSSGIWETCPKILGGYEYQNPPPPPPQMEANTYIIVIEDIETSSGLFGITQAFALLHVVRRQGRNFFDFKSKSCPSLIPFILLSMVVRVKKLLLLFNEFMKLIQSQYTCNRSQKKNFSPDDALRVVVRKLGLFQIIRKKFQYPQ